jgi:hypothetical protein
VNAVPACRRADQHEEISRCSGVRAHNARLLHQTHAHRVHQRVAGIAGLEDRFSSHRGNAHAVAVSAHAGYHAADDVAQPRIVCLRRGGAGSTRRKPEAQGIEHGNRPGAHSEDIAQDAAHTRGRTLIGLDCTGVVMALHLEHQREPTTQADGAGVLARTL